MLTITEIAGFAGAGLAGAAYIPQISHDQGPLLGWRYTAARSVAMKAAAVRENVWPGERASVVGSPGMGLAG